jgi:hypothetical protein
MKTWAGGTAKRGPPPRPRHSERSGAAGKRTDQPGRVIPGNHHTKTQNMIYYQISKIYPKKLGQTVGEILGR